MKTYREPILAQIHRALGVATVIFGAIALVLAMLSPSMGPSEMLVVLIATVISAVILFGVGQVISFIGRTAHYTEALYELHAHSATQALNPKPAAPAREPLPPGTVECPHCAASLKIQFLGAGLNLCPKCGGEFEVTK